MARKPCPVHSIHAYHTNFSGRTLIFYEKSSILLSQQAEVKTNLMTKKDTMENVDSCRTDSILYDTPHSFFASKTIYRSKRLPNPSTDQRYRYPTKLN